MVLECGFFNLRKYIIVSIQTSVYIPHHTWDVILGKLHSKNKTLMCLIVVNFKFIDLTMADSFIQISSLLLHHVSRTMPFLISYLKDENIFYLHII